MKPGPCGCGPVVRSAFPQELSRVAPSMNESHEPPPSPADTPTPQRKQHSRRRAVLIAAAAVGVCGAAYLVVAYGLILPQSVLDIPTRGASYQRQREVATRTGGDLVAVVDSVVQELRSAL